MVRLLLGIGTVLATVFAPVVKRRIGESGEPIISIEDKQRIEVVRQTPQVSWKYTQLPCVHKKGRQPIDPTVTLEILPEGATDTQDITLPADGSEQWFVFGFVVGNSTEGYIGDAYGDRRLRVLSPGIARDVRVVVREGSKVLAQRVFQASLHVETKAVNCIPITEDSNEP